MALEGTPIDGHQQESSADDFIKRRPILVAKPTFMRVIKDLHGLFFYLVHFGLLVNALDDPIFLLQLIVGQ